MADPVVSPPTFARPSRFRDFLGVSDYLRDLHRTLVLGLGKICDALNTGVAQYGEWTPTITAADTAGTPTYTAQAGIYTLRGADCTVWGRVQISAWAGSPSGSVSIGGLPFAQLNMVNAIIPTFHQGGIDLTANYTHVVGLIQSESTTIDLFEEGDNVAAQAVDAAAITAASLHLRVTGTYRIDQS